MAASAPWYQNGPGGRILLSGKWLFRADPSGQGLAGGWARQTGTAGWTPTTVPNAWNAGDDSQASMNGGIGWYRRDFRVPRQPAHAAWIVRFESVNYRATVFLNGRQIGRHEAASIPFELQLKNLHRGTNHLVVRVDSRRNLFSMPPGPSGGWFNYGGILREVYLRPVTQLDISELLTRTIDRRHLLVRATVRNVDGSLRVADVSALVAGRPVLLGTVRVGAHKSQSVSRTVTLYGIHEWAPRNASLFDVSARVTAGGHVLATYHVRTGMRTLRVTPHGRLEMNGRALNLRGAAIHEQTPTEGAALTPADHALQIKELLQVHADLTRAHYPLSEDFLERADRAGIAVWEEIPFYRMGRAAIRSAAVRKKGLAYLAATIRRDEDHPSVIAWSIGNELPPSPGPTQAAYIRDAVALAHRLDPTRPVGLAISGYPVKNYLQAYAPLDIIGINDYFGWYHGPLGQIENSDALGQYLDRVHHGYPRKAIVVTEFGAEANRDGPADEKGTYAYQQDFMSFHLTTYAARPWISGAIVWTLQDFKVRPNWDGGNPIPDPPWLRKGLLDQNGNPKPAWAPTAQAFEQTNPLVKP